MRHFALIAYDISNDRRRARVARILTEHGTRVQYSVFEVDLHPARLQALLQRLRNSIDSSEDHLRIYPLDRDTLDRVEVLGGPRPYETPSCWIV